MRRTFARVLLSLAAAAVLVFQSAAAAPQASTITDNMTIPIEFFAISCTGEEVVINGEQHIVFHATGTPSGHGVERLHINFQLSGVSASGTTYVVNEAVNSTTTTRAPDGAPSTFTTVSHLNVVSQGGEDNFRVRTIIHTTVNANGEITAVTSEFTTECNG